jgi:hypothetical protein
MLRSDLMAKQLAFHTGSWLLLALGFLLISPSLGLSVRGYQDGVLVSSCPSGMMILIASLIVSALSFYLARFLVARQSPGVMLSLKSATSLAVFLLGTGILYVVALNYNHVGSFC